MTGLAFQQIYGTIIARKDYDMNIQLPQNREQFVRSLVQNGRYASEVEVIDEALRLLEQRDRQSASEQQRIELLLLEGLDSGPATPMSSDDWDYKKQRQRLDAGRKVTTGTRKAARQAKRLETPLSPDEVNRRLLASGLVIQLPDPAQDIDDADDFPIEIQGEPLSETIIRERR